MSNVGTFHSIPVSTFSPDLSTGPPTQDQTEGLINQTEATANYFEDGYIEDEASSLGACFELDTNTQVTHTLPIPTLPLSSFSLSLFQVCGPCMLNRIELTESQIPGVAASRPQF